MAKLSDKFFIITGASSGIGRASALRFVSDGASVAALDVDKEGLAQTVAQISEQGGKAYAYALDITQADQVEATLEQIAERHSSIDGLFNVVGGSGSRHGDGPIDECSLDGWDFTMTLNLKSVYLMCKYTLPHLKEGSSLINLGSVLGLTGNPEFATHAYAASKGAVVSMSRAMAVHYAPQGIRVNVIAPGLVKTAMSARAESNTSIMNLMKRMQPLTGTIGEAEAIADVAAFLASDDARFMTGVVIPVDGGWTAQ